MIPDKFKPMLAGKAPEDLRTLMYPVLASPKLDGIRCLVFGGVAYSRALKPIPNEFVQEQLANLPDGLDGELMLADDHTNFNAVQSAVMRKDGEPDFRFCVFDWHGIEGGYASRYDELENTFGGEDAWHTRVNVVPHTLTETHEDLTEQDLDNHRMGFEGTMVRSLMGHYKLGRSTTKQGLLLKIKQFSDDEARIVGYVEREHNDNVKEVDNLGHTKRSSAKAGKRGAGDLGAFECERPDGVRFNVGTGYSAEQRVQFWEARNALMGKLLKYRHQPGPNDPADMAPRFPTFLGFRDERDTSK